MAMKSVDDTDVPEPDRTGTADDDNAPPRAKVVTGRVNPSDHTVTLSGEDDAASVYQTTDDLLRRGAYQIR